MMNIVIIGSGNVATIFAQLLQKQKHKIVQIYSKNIHHAETLAQTVNAKATNQLSQINTTADLYIIAVNDQAIETICNNLKLNNQLVVHTAASVSINILAKVSQNYGVLYPIQSIRKEMKIDTPIPFAIDGNNDFSVAKILSVAKSISKTVIHYNDAQRLKLHVAAIFACNFVNYMYVQSSNFCEKEQLNFLILQPLIEETANRLAYQKPSEVFTGPAVRGDISTIHKHLELLKQYPHLESLYQLLSEKIMKENEIV